MTLTSHKSLTDHYFNLSLHAILNLWVKANWTVRESIFICYCCCCCCLLMLMSFCMGKFNSPFVYSVMLNVEGIRKVIRLTIQSYANEKLKKMNNKQCDHSTNAKCTQKPRQSRRDKCQFCYSAFRKMLKAVNFKRVRKLFEHFASGNQISLRKLKSNKNDREVEWMN